MEDIKELVDRERKENNHYYLYTAMRVIAKQLGIKESTVNQKYYQKKIQTTIQSRFKKMANEVIDYSIERDDHIEEFIDDVEKLIIQKLKHAYKLGQQSTKLNSEKADE